MTTLVNHKFDAQSDPSRPKLGEVIEHGGMKYKIAEVEPITTSELTKSLLSRKTPDLRGHDELLYRGHPTRPFVQWACWVDKTL